MTTKIYLYIVFRIVLLVGVSMLLTYMTPHLRTFFGDTPAPTYMGITLGSGEIDRDWVWGARHYWYFLGMVCIFVASLFKTMHDIILMSDINAKTD